MKLAILERDGTICQPVAGQLSGHEAWHALPDAIAAIARLNQAGWHVALVASQPGLGRGLYDCAALNDYHRKMYKELAAASARVDAVFFCPHAPEDHCECFAPQTHLLRQILERYNVEASKVAVVACSATLLLAAADMGAGLHQIESSPDSATALPATSALQSVQRHASLSACAEALLLIQPARPQPAVA